jgi:hypothetical protein
MQNTDRKSQAFFVPSTTPRPTGTVDFSNADIFTLHKIAKKRRFTFIIYYIHKSLYCQGHNATILILFEFHFLVIMTAIFGEIQQF